MKSKKGLKFLLVAVIVLSLSIALASCAPKDNDGDDLSYAIPEDLTVNVGIYFLNGEQANEKGKVTKDVLSGLNQQIITMTTVNDFGTEKETNYVAYAVTDIIEKLEITLPTSIEKIKIIASDGYESDFTITSLANSYITIGLEENEEFVKDLKNVAQQGPRFISDKTSTSSKSVTKMLAKIIINPVASESNNNGDDLSYAIPEDLTVNVGIYFLNEEQLNRKGLVTKSVLNTLTQQIITMTTVNDAGTEKETTYVAYAVTDIIEKLEITLPTSIEKIKIIASDGYESDFTITSLANSYITIGLEENEEFVKDLKNGAQQGPRFISDKTSTSSKSVTKMLAKIIINPVVQDYVIPESVVANIELFEGEDSTATKIGTVTNSVLLSVRQQVVEMTTVKNEVETVTKYVAYSLKDIFTYLGYDAPAAVSITGISDDGDYAKNVSITSYEDAYITIGMIDAEDEFEEDLKNDAPNAPRYIPDINGTSSGSVVKLIEKLIINPSN